jgi:DNA-binding CsgD family transcriptional regulator
VATTPAAALDRIERLCDGVLTAKALREQVLAEIRRVLPFDAHAWLLTDPVTRVGTSPLADVPGLDWDRLPELGRQRYLTRTNRWTDLLDAGTPVSTLVAATGGDLSLSPLGREVQSGFGVVDVAAVAFGDRFGCWGWLDLWRRAPGPVYGAADRRFLESLQGPVTAGLRRALARTFVDASPAVPLQGPAVVVLGPDLQVRSQTTGAIEALHRLNPPDDPIPAIPAAAYNVAAALIAAEEGVPVGPPWSRVHLSAGRWVTLHAARMARGQGEGDIAVTIESSTPTERIEIFALAHGLSPREREVLSLLATGADSRSIAEQLFLSEHTVNDHVKAVLAKTGSATRQVLVSRAVGATG